MLMAVWQASFSLVPPALNFKLTEVKVVTECGLHWVSWHQLQEVLCKRNPKCG